MSIEQRFRELRELRPSGDTSDLAERSVVHARGRQRRRTIGTGAAAMVTAAALVVGGMALANRAGSAEPGVAGGPTAWPTNPNVTETGYETQVPQIAKGLVPAGVTVEASGEPGGTGDHLAMVELRFTGNGGTTDGLVMVGAIQEERSSCAPLDPGITCHTAPFAGGTVEQAEVTFPEAAMLQTVYHRADGTQVALYLKNTESLAERATTPLNAQQAVEFVTSKEWTFDYWLSYPPQGDGVDDPTIVPMPLTDKIDNNDEIAAHLRSLIQRHANHDELATDWTFTDANWTWPLQVAGMLDDGRGAVQMALSAQQLTDEESNVSLCSPEETCTERTVDGGLLVTHTVDDWTGSRTVSVSFLRADHVLIQVHQTNASATFVTRSAETMPIDIDGLIAIATDKGWQFNQAAFDAQRQR